MVQGKWSKDIWRRRRRRRTTAGVFFEGEEKGSGCRLRYRRFNTPVLARPPPEALFSQSTKAHPFFPILSIDTRKKKYSFPLTTSQHCAEETTPYSEFNPLNHKEKTNLPPTADPNRNLL